MRRRQSVILHVSRILRFEPVDHYHGGEDLAIDVDQNMPFSHGHFFEALRRYSVALASLWNAFTRPHKDEIYERSKVHVVVENFVASRRSMMELPLPPFQQANPWDLQVAAWMWNSLAALTFH